MAKAANACRIWASGVVRLIWLAATVSRSSMRAAISSSSALPSSPRKAARRGCRSVSGSKACPRDMTWETIRPTPLEAEEAYRAAHLVPRGV